MHLSRGLKSIPDLSLGAAQNIYSMLRRCTRALGIRPSQYPWVVKLMGAAYARFPALLALVEAVEDPYGRVDTFDRNYAVKADHWGYSTNPITGERNQRVLNLLDSVRAGRRFGQVLEIACAEGIFTELLAPICDSILAVDFSEIALERARSRRNWEGRVTFSHWNLRTDPVPGYFDVIVVMDVLSYSRSPARLCAAVDKLAAALRPGDILLACDYREDKDLRSLENSRIGKWLLFGGKWVIETLTSNPALEVIATDKMETHVFALLRKKPLACTQFPANHK